MKKIALGLMLLTSTTAFAEGYITEFPSNTDRITALMGIKPTIELLVESVTKLQRSSNHIKTMSISSKNMFCMDLGSVNALENVLKKHIEDSTPPAPYMLNAVQDEFLDIAKELSGSIGRKTWPLNEYCKGNFKLDIVERNQKISELALAGKKAIVDYTLMGDQLDGLLAPMTISELREVTNDSREKEAKEIEATKECTFF